MIINNTKYAGTLAQGFKHTVLEATVKDNILSLSFAEPVWTEPYRTGKQNFCTMEIESGFVDKKPINLDLIGIEEVKGVGLESLEYFLTEQGFVYNPVTKSFTTPAKREESLKAQKEIEATERKEASLPDLTGSEKQIAWALTLRSNVLKKLETDKANNIKTLTTLKKPLKMEEEAFNKMVEEGLAIVEEKTSALINQAKTETSAKFFIDNQKLEINFNQLCGDLVKKYNFR